MTIGGWIFMVVSLAMVCSVTLWAYVRLLGAPRDRTDDPDGGGPSPPPPSA